MDYNKNNTIDLHIHSTASDGTFSPSEIVDMAVNLNLKAIAITDHDTIDGSKDAIAHGIPSCLQFLTGIEISASFPSSFSGSGSLHILGYAINLNDSVLNQTLEKLQRARNDRNPLIIKCLNKLGFDFSLDDVSEKHGGGQLGRPHIAKFMIEKGFVTSVQEAFDKYLGKDKPAYVSKYRLDCNEAIEIILGAGGVPVIAHPFLTKLDNHATVEDLIISLKSMGLMGVEVYYSEHPSDITTLYADIAKRYDLLMTGGSDFHGSLKPDIKMGSGKNNLSIPYKLYDDLIKKNRSNMKFSGI